MTDLSDMGVIELAATLAAAADRFAEVDRQTDEYRARLERQGREYWIKRDLERNAK